MPPISETNDHRTDESHTTTDHQAGDGPATPTTARPYCSAPSCWRPGARVEFATDDRDPVVLCQVHRRDYFGVSS